MRLAERSLEQALKRGMAPAYLIAGDEPLLANEAADAVRAAAAAAGFTEREIHFAERGFRWGTLTESACNLSLFATRRIVEVRMPTPKPGDEGAQALRTLLENPDPDCLLLVLIGARLDASVARSVWVKTFDKHGVIVDAWPVDRRDLPKWIATRARRLKLNLAPAAAELLADRTEGNLLAADQELRKLALTSADVPIDEAVVLEAVASSARFDVFRFTDAWLAGDARRTIRVLRGLRAEGVAPPLVMWALVRELVLVTRVKFATAQGRSAQSAMQQLGVWERRRPLVGAAVQRYSYPALKALIARAAEVDRQIKSSSNVNPWDALFGLLLAALRTGRSRGARAA